MSHFPFLPRAVVVYVSPGPSGVFLTPTLSLTDRVSSSRHGVIGTNDDAFAEPAASAVMYPAAADKVADRGGDDEPT
jgi:hypothetical protein